MIKCSERRPDPPRIDRNRLEVSMTKVDDEFDGRWLISGVRAL
jgi:hypothetical protein